MNRKLIWAIVAVMLMLAAVSGVCFQILSSLLPEQLVAAQVYRPVVTGNPMNLRLPTWFVDVHWRFAGEKIVDSTNRNSPTIVRFMLGTEIRQVEKEYTYPVDKRRFSELMRKYVCETRSDIPTSAEIARHRRLETVPVYVDALRYCAKTREKGW